jgi:hypothetical protein
MKNPLLKIAAVAATVVIVMLVLTLTPNNVTFARVAESFLNARTVVFDINVGDEVKGFTARDIVIGSKLRRNVPSLNNILIMEGIYPDRAAGRLVRVFRV